MSRILWPRSPCPANPDSTHAPRRLHSHHAGHPAQTIMWESNPNSRSLPTESGFGETALERELGGLGPIVGFLLQNPSVAGHTTDDPTSRRGIGFARAWSGSRLVYINAWAGIATKPKNLWIIHDPIGPENDAHIAEVARLIDASQGFIVMAFGRVAAPA